MSKRKNVIVVYEPTSDLCDGLKAALPDADIRNAIQDEDADAPETTLSEKLLRKVTANELSLMQEADILVCPSFFLAQVMYDLPDVDWVQLSTTGVDRLMKGLQKDKPNPSYIVTRNISKDIGLIMAEYVVGQMICHERSWYLTRQNQLQKSYDRSFQIARYRSLNQLSVGLLGLGPLALEVARALKHFGCRVSGYSRTPKGDSDRSPFVDTYWHSGQLASFLSECDYIICILPSTPETQGLLGGHVLKDAKRSPVLVNVGRGDLISEGDLLRALDAGWISAALLDVCEKEPLPEESSLWTHPKVFMTPHVSASGNTVCRTNSVIDCFTQNYRHYIDGKPLLGLLDWSAGY